MTYCITLPQASADLSMLEQEERLMEALNAVGRAGARHLLGAFDAHGQPLVHEQRNWTSKGKVAKIYETPWGEVMLERHLYQTSSGMKWTRSGVQTVLTLRALLLSTSRWTSLWTYFDKHGLP